MSTKIPSNHSDAAVPHSSAMANLSHEEKQALEQKERAEHESNAERTRLQKEAEQKVD